MKRAQIVKLAWAAALTTVLGTGSARAQSFPTVSWGPLPCGTEVMNDLYRDQSGAIGERDIVGDLSAPAGYSSSDGQLLYLRLRLDQDPAPGGSLRPFAWGVGISVDGDTTSYEILLVVNGQSGQVEVYQNTEVTRVDDPQDPADQPPVATYPFAEYGQSSEAPGSAYGGDPDYFLDFAVPWTDLTPLGLTPLTPAAIWAGSSSSANALNGDLACQDGAQGAPTLSGSVDGSTVLNPQPDTDGDGYTDQQEVEAGSDPNDAASTPEALAPGTRGQVELEGGGGCALSRAGVPWSGLVLVLVVGLGLLGWRRRK